MAVTGSTLRYRKSSLTAGRIVEGLAFVVTPDDNKLHTLNETATRLWKLAEGGVTAAEAAGVLAREFAVDADTALADAQACLDDLATRGILVADD